MNVTNERTCIVTRQAGQPKGLIRFVAAPDMAVVPDLKRNLPGRGCWVTAERAHVATAVKRNLFARALRAKVTAAADLAEMVDALLARNALGALGLARKSGRVVLGATKVEAGVRGGRVGLVLHALEASPDGVRRIEQARRVVASAGGPVIQAVKLFSEAELSLALGGSNVIHAAVLDHEAGRAAVERVMALHRYRGGFPENDRTAIAAVDELDGAAEDTQ